MEALKLYILVYGIFALAGLTFVYFSIRLFNFATGRTLLKVGSPCSQHWSEFKGDSKVRFCDLCQKNVHSICNMNKAERKVLLERSAKGDKAELWGGWPWTKESSRTLTPSATRVNYPS